MTRGLRQTKRRRQTIRRPAEGASPRRVAPRADEEGLRRCGRVTASRAKLCRHADEDAVRGEEGRRARDGQRRSVFPLTHCV